MADAIKKKSELDIEDARLRILGKISNASRLYSDAIYLLKDDRTASAAALSTVALEEIGKLVLYIWAQRDISPKGRRRTSHLSKQSAVASLLLSAALVPTIRDRAKKGNIHHDTINELARAFVGSEQLQLSIFVELGGLEKQKHLALYWDEENYEAGLEARSITRKDVQSILDILDPALDAAKDSVIVEIAAALYDLAGTMIAKR